MLKPLSSSWMFLVSEVPIQTRKGLRCCMGPWETAMLGGSSHLPDTQNPISHCLLQGTAAAGKGINDHDDPF